LIISWDKGAIEHGFLAAPSSQKGVLGYPPVQGQARGIKQIRG